MEENLEEVLAESSLKEQGFTKGKIEGQDVMWKATAQHCLVYRKHGTDYKVSGIYDRRMGNGNVQSRRAIPMQGVTQTEPDEVILREALRANKQMMEAMTIDGYVVLTGEQLVKIGFRKHNRFGVSTLYTGYLQKRNDRYYQVYFQRRAKDGKYEFFSIKDKTREYKEYESQRILGEMTTKKPS